MALLAHTQRRAHRPDNASARSNTQKPRFAQTDRIGLERSRNTQYGLADLPCILPVLCGRWPTVLPAVPAQRRYFPGSEQHTSELQSLMRISYAVFFLKKK